jgi:DNA sulfur modification protein DndD
LRIKKIVLKNLFSFNGIQEISFEEKTLILAENGFGKTSLLNSIKLALGQKKVKIDSILNGSAMDKECFIEIDFDTFTLRRIWDFEESFESLSIYLDDNILKDYEAEEFLKEKFPVELIDFIFFDGEVEKDLILVKSKKIKRIFEYSFDLDILSNMIVDTKKVANRLSNKLGNEEIIKFTNLQEQEVRLAKNILDIEERKPFLDKEIRRLKELLRLNELKIRNRSKAIESLQQKIDENQLELSKEIELFQEINLYQLPLLLNSELLNKVNSKTTQSLKVLNQKEFELKFEVFVKSLNSPDEKSELLQNFYQVFQMNSSINLSFSKKELIIVLEKLRDLIDTQEKLLKQLEEIKEKLVKKDNLKKLELEGIELTKKKHQKELEFNQINDRLDEKQSKYKEVHKQLRLEFIAKRDKYAKIRAIEELYNISEVSQEVYDRKLFGSLNQFNTLLSEKVKPFLSIHQHIKKIYINDKFKVILEDEKGSFLEMELLSAGQKQILSFILISSILEFKKFVDFIFIDTPFGRLSNNSRDFIFNNYYLKFSYLTLLVTSSEYDYIEQQESSFKEYTIERNKLGSTIGVVKND